MTRREREVATWYHDQIVLTGVAPTYREAATHLHVGCTSVYKVVKRLMKAGHIVRSGPRNGRGAAMQVTLPGKGLLAAEVAWCHANPERVRAMIELTGGAVQ